MRKYLTETKMSNACGQSWSILYKFCQDKSDLKLNCALSLTKNAPISSYGTIDSTIWIRKISSIKTRDHQRFEIRFRCKGILLRDLSRWRDDSHAIPQEISQSLGATWHCSLKHLRPNVNQIHRKDVFHQIYRRSFKMMRNSFLETQEWGTSNNQRIHPLEKKNKGCVTKIRTNFDLNFSPYCASVKDRCWRPWKLDTFRKQSQSQNGRDVETKCEI